MSDSSRSPTPLAVALAYRTGDAAPKVVARGSGAIAETIIERAREAGVYVHESTELVALLMKVDLDQRIPPQLYVAVAELLAWLYQIEAGGAIVAGIGVSGAPGQATDDACAKAGIAAISDALELE